MQERRKIITRPGKFNINIAFLPNLTQAQLEFKFKQEYKKKAGLLSEQWLKHRNLNREQNLDKILTNLNYAKTIFEAKQLIKNKKIIINNKTITSPSYTIKPFANINIKTTKPESTLLGKAKKQNINNPANCIINNKIFLS